MDKETPDPTVTANKGNDLAWDAWKGMFFYTHRSGDRDKRFLGTRSPRQCRFCGRTNSETTFRRDAHVIPAAFGNRTLFSQEECDECNLKLGSALEDDLAKFLSLPRAISRLPGRKGTPKIRHWDQAAFVKSNREENKVHIYQPSKDEGVRVVDEGNGTFRLTIDTPAYRPVNVARALGRMLLFVLDKTESGFERVLSWVRGEIEWFPIPLVTLHFPSAGYDGVSLMVHRYTRTPDRRIVRVGFLYSSFLTVMPIPLDEWALPAGLALLNYPPPHHEVLRANTSLFVVKNTEVERAGSAEAILTYEKRNVE